MSYQGPLYFLNEGYFNTATNIFYVYPDVTQSVKYIIIC